jgi:hypothetical protein
MNSFAKRGKMEIILGWERGFICASWCKQKLQFFIVNIGKYDLGWKFCDWQNWSGLLPAPAFFSIQMADCISASYSIYGEAPQKGLEDSLAA